MERHKFLKAVTIGVISCAMVTMVAAAPAPNSQAGPAGPGTLNYIEGQVSLDGSPVNSQQSGSVMVQPGQVLSTATGKAEMLLTPGVFLRLGDNSQVRITSAGLADMRLELLQGQATVEADYLVKETHLTVDQGMASTRILKKGLYILNSNQPFVQVLDGQAEVTANGQHVKAGKGGEVAFNTSGKLKKQGFRIQTAENEALVRWSRLRSSYESQANIDTANYVADNDGGWYGPGWYWDAGYGFWSFLPGDGILYNPWGFGFYSPFYAPGFVGGFYGGGYYGGRFDRGLHDRDFGRGQVARGGQVRGGGFRGGFRGGATGMRGGMRGGMAGGMRGGMGGGGFHGGGARGGGGHR